MLRCASVGLAGGLLLGGCASWTEVKVDSLAKPRAADAISYQIHNANPANAADTLRYKEAAGYVRTALSGKGLYEAPPGTPSDLVVELDYGISAPRHGYKTVQQPIWGTVPGESTPVSKSVGIDAQGTPVTQTVMVQGPSTLQVTGYRDVVVVSITYEKHLRLSAHENKTVEGGGPAPEVWTVEVISEGENHDLRKALPILAAVTIDYVGKDSHGQKVIRVKDTDPAVAFVKHGM
jgi:hypothetical protein